MKSYQETPSKSVNCNLDYNMPCIMSWNALDHFKDGVKFSPERLKYDGSVASRLFQVFPDMLARFHHAKKDAYGFFENLPYNKETMIY